MLVGLSLKRYFTFIIHNKPDNLHQSSSLNLALKSVFLIALYPVNSPRNISYRGAPSRHQGHWIMSIPT